MSLLPVLVTVLGPPELVASCLDLGAGGGVHQRSAGHRLGPPIKCGGFSGHFADWEQTTPSPRSAVFRGQRIW